MPSIFSGLEPISSSSGGSLDHEELNKLKTDIGTEDISSVGTSVKDAIKKLNDKNEEYNYLVPEQFGAVGDGETDDYNAFLQMYEYARYKKKNVFLCQHMI